MTGDNWQFVYVNTHQVISQPTTAILDKTQPKAENIFFLIFALTASSASAVDTTGAVLEVLIYSRFWLSS